MKAEEYLRSQRQFGMMATAKNDSDSDDDIDEADLPPPLEYDK